MNKTKRVVFTSIAVTIALVGVLNIIDSIYAGTPVSAEGLNMSATIEPSATIALSADVSLDVVPSTDGTFASSGVTVNAYTNSSNCTVTMTTASEGMSLTSQTTDSTIGPLAANTTYTSSDFLDNAWGYSLNGTNYYRVGASNEIGTFDATTSSWKTLTFATKLNQAIKPGTYTGTVTFVSYCDPPLPPAVNYMQDMTQSTLATLMPNVGDDVTLTDARDGKDYTVAHLADGNYWMTQNLDHDIKTDGSVTYDSTTTDILSAWTPSTATYATNDDTWNGSYTAPESYDPGDLCWNGEPDDNTTESCSQSGNHFHLGNYYNWTAAVAMNNSSAYTMDGTDVDQSICPAGWTLPKDGATTGTGSFQYLVTQYGWEDSSYMMVGDYMMWDSPLYFPLSGSDLGGSVDGVGYGGYYWSSVAYDSNFAYYPYFYSDGGVFPGDYYNRDIGHSVRCVAR